jgi:hypothetical protein
VPEIRHRPPSMQKNVDSRPLGGATGRTGNAHHSTQRRQCAGPLGVLPVESRAMRHVTASKLSLAGKRACGSAGAKLYREAGSEAERHVAALKPTLTRRQSPEPWDTWQPVAAHMTVVFSLTLYVGVPDLQGTDKDYSVGCT